MRKTPFFSGKYSLTEMALAGRGLRAKDKEAARAFFAGCRLPDKSIASSDYKGLFRLCYYTRSMEKVRKIQKKYRALRDRPFFLNIKILKRSDWFDKWKRDYHAGPLGAKFMIVPVWEKKKFKPGRRTPIFLEPGSAFGSGYHETTRLMVRFLESLEGKFCDFLDIGTGTGILSVVASKLGALKIIGFDHDRPSAIVAGKNFRLNGCKAGAFFCDQLKHSKVSGIFDAVGANLLSKILLKHQAQIKAFVRPGGYLFVSGIGIRSFAAFKREFSGDGLKCLKILRGRSWVAALYKKPLS
jgi:ribosomal protein L11 methyltransferase